MSEIDLERFLKAQEKDYSTALEEIKSGKKQSCWMWYIFPQIQGLGFSEMNKKYSLKDIEEAKAYLENETLYSHLIEITQALLDLEDADIHEVMSFDDVKLHSSMTLFKIVEEQCNIDCGKIFQKTLDKYFKGEDDQGTIRILEKQKFEKEMNKIKINSEVNEENVEKETENNNKDEDLNIRNEIIIENNKNDNIENNNKNNFETQNENNKEEDNNIKNVDSIEQLSQNEEKEEEEIKEEKKENNKNTIRNRIIEASNNTIKSAGSEEEKSLNEKESDGYIKIIEENKVLVQDEVINIKKINNNNAGGNTISDNSDILNKKKSVHFSLPSRAQIKSMENIKSSSDDVEMIITDKKIEQKGTIVLFPFDDENGNENDKKKCCPECIIF
jgi:uncharacterized protein (DUF1810 family)